MLLNVGAGGAAAEAEALPLSDDAGGDTRRALDCVTVPRRPPKARSRSISASWARSEKCDDGGGDVPAFTSRSVDMMQRLLLLMGRGEDEGDLVNSLE